MALFIVEHLRINKIHIHNFSTYSYLNVPTKRKNTKSKIIIIIGAVILFVILSIILYPPFMGNLKDMLIPIINRSQMRGVFMSPLIIIFLNITIFFNKNPLELVIAIRGASFIALYFYIIFDIIRNRLALQKNYKPTIYRLMGLSLLVLYLSSFTWTMPWYFILLLALFSVTSNISKSKERVSSLVIFGFTFYGIIYYLTLR